MLRHVFHCVGEQRFLLFKAQVSEKAGTLAVPHWLPRGGMVKVHNLDGLYSYIAADQGHDVETARAAKELGKTIE